MSHYYSVYFDHDGGQAIHFFESNRKVRREETERMIEQSLGFKNVILISFNVYPNKSAYQRAQLSAEGDTP